jgi:hypothetical protein
LTKSRRGLSVDKSHWGDRYRSLMSFPALISRSFNLRYLAIHYIDERIVRIEWDKIWTDHLTMPS